MASYTWVPGSQSFGDLGLPVLWLPVTSAAVLSPSSCNPTWASLVWKKWLGQGRGGIMTLAEGVPMAEGSQLSLAPKQKASET